MQKIMFIFFLSLSGAGAVQAQFLKKLKDKVSQAVEKPADRATNKTAEKTKDKKSDNKTAGINSGEENGISADQTTFPPGNDVVDHPSHLAIDSKDNLYVIDKSGIVKITPDGVVKRISTKGGGLISIGENDNIYISQGSTINNMYVDSKGNCKIDYYAGDKNYNGSGDGSLEAAKFNNIRSMFVAKNGDIYIADIAGKLIKNLGGIKSDQLAFEPGAPARLKSENSWDWWVIIRKISKGKVTTLKNSNGQYMLFSNLSGMTLDAEDNIIYSGGGFSRAVRKLDTKTMRISTLAGMPFKREWCPVYTVGDTSKAELFDPGFLLYDKKGNIVYSDNRNHRITRIANGNVSTLAGNNKIDPCSQNIGGRAQEGHKDGKAGTALFNFPQSMAYDTKGNLFILDSHNSVIRKLSPDGMVSSFTPFDRSKADITD